MVNNIDKFLILYSLLDTHKTTNAAVKMYLSGLNIDNKLNTKKTMNGKIYEFLNINQNNYDDTNIINLIWIIINILKDDNVIYNFLVRLFGDKIINKFNKYTKTRDTKILQTIILDILRLDSIEKKTILEKILINYISEL